MLEFATKLRLTVYGRLLLIGRMDAVSSLVLRLYI